MAVTGSPKTVSRGPSSRGLLLKASVRFEFFSRSSYCKGFQTGARLLKGLTWRVFRRQQHQKNSRRLRGSPRRKSLGDEFAGPEKMVLQNLSSTGFYSVKQTFLQNPKGSAEFWGAGPYPIRMRSRGCISNSSVHRMPFWRGVLKDYLLRRCWMLKFLGNRMKAASKKSLFRPPSRRTPCGQGVGFLCLASISRLERGHYPKRA